MQSPELTRFEREDSLTSTSNDSESVTHDRTITTLDWIEIVDDPTTVNIIGSPSFTFSDPENGSCSNFPPDIMDNDSIVDDQFYLGFVGS